MQLSFVEKIVFSLQSVSCADMFMTGYVVACFFFSLFVEWKLSAKTLSCCLS